MGVMEQLKHKQSVYFRGHALQAESSTESSMFQEQLSFRQREQEEPIFSI